MGPAHEQAPSREKMKLIGGSGLIGFDQHSAVPLRGRTVARPSMLVAEAIEYTLKRVQVFWKQRHVR
ncbi:hypothetical protein I6F26_27675 [Ensifer sp. IC3342]|nr:hypothetical protein [Ensifer sp. BRP08]MCA1450335.1 hypothetical protein [Ensifer sp. IC3342]